MKVTRLDLLVTSALLLLLTGCAAAASNSAEYAPQEKHESQACPCIYVSNIKHNRKANDDSVTVYPIGAKNDASPIQYITGSNTGLFRPSGVAVDDRGDIFVSNHYGLYTGSGTVTAYSPGSTGNAPPYMTIGPFYCCSSLIFPLGIALDPVNGDLYVSNEGSRGYCEQTVSVFRPTGRQRGNLNVASCPAGLVLDPAGDIYVPGPNSYGSYGSSCVSSARICGVIEIYAPGSNGHKKPTSTIAGPNTRLYWPSQLALDSNLNIYAANYRGDSVTVYAHGSTGNSAPIATISGSNTQLDSPSGIALDQSGKIYVANHDNAITVYNSGANGNAAPIRRIRGPSTYLHYPQAIIIR